MVQQLAVYDESGTQVGMTFPKRARQLINKQRALWHNDTHTAIRLLPDIKEEALMDEYLNDDIDMDEPPSPTVSDDLLLYLAKKNVREKRNLSKHAVAFIAAWPLIGIFYAAVIEGARHPQHRRLGTLRWQVDTLREYVSVDGMWILDDVSRWGQSLFEHHLTHPIMFMIFGAMIAWGAWIVTRAVKMRAATRHSHKRRYKPDPVQMEYQRLKDISALK